MQVKQTKIAGFDIEVIPDPNDYSSQNIRTNDAPTESLINYSHSRFDNLANADVKMGLGSIPSPSVLPPDDVANSDAPVQINLSPNACFTDQTHSPNQRGRPDITFFDRLQIAARFWNPERAWGEVTQLARQYNLSRSSIYTISYRIQSLLSVPSVRSVQPKPSIESSITFAGQSFTPEQMSNIRMRLILTGVFPGGVTMRPLEDILAEVPFIGSASDTTIWRIINQAGEQADEILSQVDYSQIKLPPVLVAVDETFFNGSPILLVATQAWRVEPTSLAVCAYYVPPNGDRSAASWEAVLELLKKEQNLNFVGGLGDAKRAAAYPKAFKELFESKGCFQEDNFHLLRDIERLCSYLERKAYAAIQKVEDLVKKWQK